MHDTALAQLGQRPPEIAGGPYSPMAEAVDPANPARSLYIHIPFCAHKCHYCDFYSIVDTRDRQEAFVDRLIAELAAISDLAGAPLLDTIFIGGGTPTLLSVDLWGRLLDALGDCFDRSDDMEFTVECNPETATQECIDALVGGGVTRLSIGAQSFDEAHLRTLERRHSPGSVVRALAMAMSAGIAQRSIDLIYAIPGQTLDEWRRDLDMALDLGTTHISCYCLTYEPGTALTQRLRLGRITPAPDDVQTDMQLLALDVLRSAGFARYEVSNFACADAQCRHNLAYWRQEQWLAAGPSASAHVGGHRWKNIPHLDRYIASGEHDPLAPVVDHEPPDARRALVERLMTGLRTAEGVGEQDTIQRAHALDADTAEGVRITMDRAIACGRLCASGDRLRPTDEGFLFADALARAFMAAIDP